MTSSGVTNRHASVESFDRYLATGGDAVIPVKGAPSAFIFIHAAKRELGLRVEVDVETEAPETGLRNIVSRIAARNGVRYLEVVVTSAALFHDAYPVLCSMADRVQVMGMSPAEALRATLDKMSALLRAPEMMSRDREVGLFGELLFLRGLVHSIGANAGVQAWRGGQAEEHDFGLPEFDVEVKTTTSEHRTHWIESLTQLMPTIDRQLWLVSHQITNGGGAGRTLPDLVDEVRNSVGTFASATRFETALLESGWSDDYRDRLVTRWVLRTDSVAFLVVDPFPKLTPGSLQPNASALDRIVDVRYRINLDRLDVTPDVPEPIATAIALEGQI